MQTAPSQDLGKIRHELLARRASLRHRHERIQRDLQRRKRLERGLYGICKDCGGEIEDARLHLLHAVTCADCARD
jgi:RNA polymerase-binding transcription factor DksA